MPSRLLSCRELHGFLDDYLDRSLPEETTRRFEAHLAVCPQCVDYLDGYRQSIDLAAGLSEPDAATPPDVPTELIDAILELRQRP